MRKMLPVTLVMDEDEGKEDGRKEDQTRSWARSMFGSAGKRDVSKPGRDPCRW